MLRNFVNRLDRTIERDEKRYHPILVSIAMGLLLLGAAAIYTTPAPFTVAFGEWFEEMSLEPFDFENGPNTSLRVLSPLLAHILFMRGYFFFYFPLMFGVFFMAAIFHHFRKTGFSPSESLGATALMAFSAPILFQLHYLGYTDTTSYFLLFLSFILAKKGSWTWAVYFGLSLMNHEGNIFAVPWLVYLASGYSFRWRKLIPPLLLAGAATVPMFVFRAVVLANFDIEFDYDFYLSFERIRGNLEWSGLHLGLGLFYGFKLFWIFPLLGIKNCWERKERGVAVWYILVLLTTFAQYLFGGDSTRLAAFAFPAVLMGFGEAKRMHADGKFASALWGFIFLNMLIPQFSVINRMVVPFFPLPLSLLLLLFGVNPWAPDIWMA